MLAGATGKVVAYDRKTSNTNLPFNRTRIAQLLRVVYVLIFDVEIWLLTYLQMDVFVFEHFKSFTNSSPMNGVETYII